MGRPSPAHLTFWGVRGSIPTPGPSTLRYGGETTCIEVTFGDRRVIVDAGSGIRHLGDRMIDDGPADLDLLLTHTHFDHVCGLPFFCPAYAPAGRVTVQSGHLPPETASGGTATENALRLAMSPPLFPVDLAELRIASYRDFRAGAPLDLGHGIHVETIALNHPGGSTGYRFDHGGTRFAIITDHEHGDPKVDEALVAFVRDVDIMVYDCMYWTAEYARREGWGHSTPAAMLALAERAGVARPIAFHHMPERGDDALDGLAEWLRTRHPGALVAKEGDEHVIEAAPVRARERVSASR